MTVYFATILVVFLLTLMSENAYLPRWYRGRNQNNKVKNLDLFIVLFVAVTLILVAGLRWKVGTDYFSYVRNYQHYISEFWNSIVSFDEPGIRIIALISSWIYNDYITMIFIASVITIGLSIRTIYKYSDYYGISLLLFIFTGLWHGSFNGIRQFLAAAIIFAGYRFIIDKKIVKYLILIFIACAFHISAIIMLPFYFIALRKIDLKQVLLIGVVAIVLFFSYDRLFGLAELVKNEAIIETEYTTNSVNFLRVFVTLVPVLIFFIFKPKRLLTKVDYFYVNVFLINAAFMIITMNSAYLARIGIYTNYLTVLAYPRLLTFYKRDFSNILKYSIIFFYFIYWYIEVSKSSSLNNFMWIFER